MTGERREEGEERREKEKLQRRRKRSGVTGEAWAAIKQTRTSRSARDTGGELLRMRGWPAHTHIHLEVSHWSLRCV